MKQQTVQIDIAQQVKDILVDVLLVDEEQLTPLARLGEDLGADSLDRCELSMHIEDAMSCELDEDDMDKCATVKDLIDMVQKAKA